MGNTTQKSKNTPAQQAAQAPVEAPPVHHANAASEERPEAQAPVIIQPIDAVPAQVASAPPAPAWGALLGLLLIASCISAVLVRVSRMQVLLRLKRWMPLAHLLVWGLALLLCASIALSTFPTQWLIFSGAALLTLGLAAISGLRSALAGLGLALEGRLRVGDTVQVPAPHGALQGEIVSFGLRAVRLRSPDGMTHDIPNERFMHEAVSTLGSSGGEAVCEVTVRIPAFVPIEQAVEIAREGALLSPLASPRHRPEVFIDARDPGQLRTLRIRGYAFDPDFHDHFRSDVIRRVGRAVDELAAASEPPPAASPLVTR